MEDAVGAGEEIHAFRMARPGAARWMGDISAGGGGIAGPVTRSVMEQADRSPAGRARLPANRKHMGRNLLIVAMRNKNRNVCTVSNLGQCRACVKRILAKKKLMAVERWRQGLRAGGRCRRSSGTSAHDRSRLQGHRVEAVLREDVPRGGRNEAFALVRIESALPLAV